MRVITEQSIIKTVSEATSPKVMVCDCCNSTIWVGPYGVTWLVKNFIAEHGVHGVVHVVDPSSACRGA